MVNYSRRLPIPVQLKHFLKVSTVLQFTHWVGREFKELITLSLPIGRTGAAERCLCVQETANLHFDDTLAIDNCVAGITTHANRCGTWVVWSHTWFLVDLSFYFTGGIAPVPHRCKDRFSRPIRHMMWFRARRCLTAVHGNVYHMGVHWRWKIPRINLCAMRPITTIAVETYDTIRYEMLF